MKAILLTALLFSSLGFIQQAHAQAGAAEVDIRATQAVSTQVKTLREALQSMVLSLREDMKALENNLTQTKNDLNNTKNQLTQTRNELASTQNDLNTTKNQLAQTQSEMAQFKNCANRQMSFAPTSPQADGQGCVKTTFQDCLVTSATRPGQPSSTRLVKHGEIANFTYQDGGSMFGNLHISECQDGKLFSFTYTAPRDSR